MTRRRQWILLGTLGLLYLISLVWLVGTVVENRYGPRHEIARRIEAAPVAATPRTEARGSTTWGTHLEAVDAALARRDVSAAERAWRDAHGAAVRTRTWRPLLEVGDAALRIGALTHHRAPYQAKARELYLAALTRAQAERSAAGVLHVAASFDALGDRTVAQQSVRIAEGLAGARDREAGRRAMTDQMVDVRSTVPIEP
jgi:hypothetical protein